MAKYQKKKVGHYTITSFKDPETGEIFPSIWIDTPQGTVRIHTNKETVEVTTFAIPRVVFESSRDTNTEYKTFD